MTEKAIEAAQQAYRKHVAAHGVEGSTEAIAAAIAAYEAALWQPIETAPMDGSEILVCGGGISNDRTTYRDEEPFKGIAVVWFDRWCCGGENPWIGEQVGVGEFTRHSPKFWRPLPDEPKEPGQ